jgi:hypothetical protein
LAEALIDDARLALEHDLDAAVPEVSDVAGEREALERAEGSPAEPDSLDNARIEDFAPLRTHVFGEPIERTFHVESVRGLVAGKPYIVVQSTRTTMTRRL